MYGFVILYHLFGVLLALFLALSTGWKSLPAVRRQRCVPFTKQGTFVIFFLRFYHSIVDTTHMT